MAYQLLLFCEREVLLTKELKRMRLLQTNHFNHPCFLKYHIGTIALAIINARARG